MLGNAPDQVNIQLCTWSLVDLQDKRANHDPMHHRSICMPLKVSAISTAGSVPLVELDQCY